MDVNFTLLRNKVEIYNFTFLIKQKFSLVLENSDISYETYLYDQFRYDFILK